MINSIYSYGACSAARNALMRRVRYISSESFGLTIMIVKASLEEIQGHIETEAQA